MRRADEGRPFGYEAPILQLYEKNSKMVDTVNFLTFFVLRGGRKVE
jgi:hypothetical protein